MNLLEKYRKKILGHIGVAHTRWATHGKISKANTHPHVSKNIIVVHNGTIENYSVLRIFLQKKDIYFILILIQKQLHIYYIGNKTKKRIY